MLIEFHLNRDTLATRHCLVSAESSFRFHAGFTRGDAEAGWNQVKAVSAHEVSAADIAAELSQMVDFAKAYWTDLLNRCADRRVIQDGEHFVLHALGAGCGFSGRSFRVQWLDRQRASLVCNLSGQGRVPAWIRDRLPDNATVSPL